MGLSAVVCEEEEDVEARWADASLWKKVSHVIFEKFDA